MRTHSISGSFAGAPWSLRSLVGSCLPSGYSRALLARLEICRATARGKEDTSPGAAVNRTVFKTCRVKKWSPSTKHRAARGKQISGVQKQGGDTVSSGACGQALGGCYPGTAQETRNSCCLFMEHGAVPTQLSCQWSYRQYK